MRTLKSNVIAVKSIVRAFSMQQHGAFEGAFKAFSLILSIQADCLGALHGEESPKVLNCQVMSVFNTVYSYYLG